MAKDYAKKFYGSNKWQRCRGSFIANRVDIDGGACEHCKIAQGYIVDHIVEITPENINNYMITLNHDNLQYLCLECHNKKTFKTLESIGDGLMFDSNGELISIE